MKKLHYKGYCFIEITDDLKDRAFRCGFFHRTKRETIQDNTSYHGHVCDDPRKRGAVCEVDVTIKLAPMPAPSDDLREYIQLFSGRPGVFSIDADGRDFKRALKAAKAEQTGELKALKKAVR